MSRDAKTLRCAYDEACAVEREASMARERAKVELQSACTHPYVETVEGSHLENKWTLHHTPPFRVCRLCGYAEEGWGCGYSLLRHVGKEIPEMSRDGAISFVIGRIIPNTEHFDARFSQGAPHDQNVT